MELALVPSRNNVHSNTSIGVVVNAGHLLGNDSRVPGTGKNSRNDLELLGVVKESLRERDRLVLGRGTVRGSEADLSESVLEADGLGGTGIADVRLEIPAGVLGDLGDDKTARDVGDPVAVFTLALVVCELCKTGANLRKEEPIGVAVECVGVGHCICLDGVLGKGVLLFVLGR